MSRRPSVFKNVAQRRASISINAPALARIHFLDGSSKVLQLMSDSTAADALVQLKFNLNLDDISTHALFLVNGDCTRRILLTELVADFQQNSNGPELRILFKSWIISPDGAFAKSVFEGNAKEQLSNTSLWLAYLEATFMVMTGLYFLTQEESILLGCLKLQIDFGDYSTNRQTLSFLKVRVANLFPGPVCGKMKSFCDGSKTAVTADALAQHVSLVYARLSGKSKVEAQLQSLRLLQDWCPFYGGAFFNVTCQYDKDPKDLAVQPVPVSCQLAVTRLALYLINKNSSLSVSSALVPAEITRHPYKNIIKWVAQVDSSLFVYWIIKSTVSMAEIETAKEALGDQFDCNTYCDCIYISTTQLLEIELLVRSYVNLVDDMVPCLPGAVEELQEPLEQPEQHEQQQSTQDCTPTVNTTAATATAQGQAQPQPRTRNKAASGTLSTSRFASLFRALGGGGADHQDSSDDENSIVSAPVDLMSGSGLSARNNYEVTVTAVDDSRALSNSVFKNIYAAPPATAVGSQGDSVQAQALALQPPTSPPSASSSPNRPQSLSKRRAPPPPSKTLSEETSPSLPSTITAGAGATATATTAAAVASSAGSATQGRSALRRASVMLLSPFMSSSKKTADSSDDDD